ncbi:Os11g0262050 [Oryza sativa Japonica Group]|uniref:Os11g0262050 protein n=1 Tax=Oryza sativa subsp. japonica TaxID=39947 RepID=A0A0P0Y0Y9_ORYSJ|nr:Os11g0262050 [Oryza sativa Japonica Group]
MDYIDLYLLRIRCRLGNSVHARLRHLLASEITTLCARTIAISERHRPSHSPLPLSLHTHSLSGGRAGQEVSGGVRWRERGWVPSRDRQEASAR